MQNRSLATKVLSVFLAVLMVLTAGITGLYPVAEYVNAAITKTEDTGNPVFSLKWNVPESIYLKPGSSEFQYFLTDTLTTTGANANSVASTSASVTVTAPLAKSMTLSYAIEANGKDAAGNAVSATGLSLFGVTNNVTGTTSISNSLDGGSLAGYSAAIGGNEYFIKWTLTYDVEIDGVTSSYTEYAYTTVYVPFLGQAGYSLHTKYQPTASWTPSQNWAYTFLTGGHSVTGGNAVSNYTSTATSVDTEWTTSSGTPTLIAPLVKFTGGNAGDTKDDVDKPFSSGATIPWGSYFYSSYSFTAKENGGVYVYDYGKYTSGDGYNGITGDTGILNITVDTSRFTNFADIPNLGAGYAQFRFDYYGANNNLRWIAGSLGVPDLDDDDMEDANLSNAAITTDVDSSDSESYVSRALGLYDLNSTAINSGTYNICFAYRNGYSDGLGNQTNAVVTNVGLNVTGVDKTALRNAVYNAYVSAHAVKSSSSAAVVAYINAVTAGSKVLTDVFATQTEVDAAKTAIANAYSKEIDTTIESYYKSAESFSYGYVALNVPETIYLDATTNSTSSYEYVLDQTMSLSDEKVDGTATGYKLATITPNKSYKNISSGGVIEFYCDDLDTSKDVTLECSDSNVTFGTLTRDSSTGIYSTTVTAGTHAYSSGYITWTVSYTDKKDGYQKSIYAKTYIYAPSLLTAGAAALTDSSIWTSSKYTKYSSVAAIIYGIHGITKTSYRNTLYYGSTGIIDANNYDAYGLYKPYPVVNASYTPPSYTNSSNSSNLYAETCTESGLLGMTSGYGDSRTNVAVVGGQGYVYFDTLRASTYADIPNFNVGVDFLSISTYSDCEKNATWYIITGEPNSSNTAVASTRYKSGDTSNTEICRPTDFSTQTLAAGQTVISYGMWQSVQWSGETRQSYAASLCNMNGVDYTALRESIVDAQAKFKAYGIYADSTGYNGFDSLYYNKDHQAFKAFIDAYNAAQEELGKVDSGLGSAAINLDNAVDELDAAITNNAADSSSNPIKKPGTSTQSNMALIGSTVTSIKSVDNAATSFTKSYYAKDTIEYTAETYAGYDFKGFVKTTAQIPATGTYTLDGTLSYLTAANYKEQATTVGESTVTVATAQSVSYPNTVPSISSGDILYSQLIDKSVNMLGVYTPHQYNVVYYANGGTSADGDYKTDINYYGESYSYRAADTFTKSYYNFAGWNTKADGTGTTYSAGTSMAIADMPTADGATVYLYAQWTLDPNALGTVTVDANGGTFTGDLLNVSSAGTDVLATSTVSGTINATVTDSAEGISVDGTYYRMYSAPTEQSIGTLETTDTIPVWMNLTAGHTYTLSYYTTNPQLSTAASVDDTGYFFVDFYFFKDGGATVRANSSASNYTGNTKTIDGVTYYEYKNTFTVGSSTNLNDCTWTSDNGTGSYQFRLDIDYAGIIGADQATTDSPFSVRELTLTETSGTADYQHTTKDIPETAIVLAEPTLTGKTFTGWTVTSGDAAVVKNESGKWILTYGGTESTVQAQWADKYYTVTYDNLFSYNDWYESGSSTLDNSSVTVSKDTTNNAIKLIGSANSQTFTNDSGNTAIVDDPYTIAVDGNTEYSFSFIQEANNSVTGNAAKVRIRMWDADGNELFVEDTADADGNYPYGVSDYKYNNGTPDDDSDDYYVPIVYILKYDSECDAIRRDWAFNPETGDSGGLSSTDKHQLYTNTAAGDGLTELYFVTPENCAYITIGFGTLKSAATEITFKNIQIHKTAVYDERTGLNFNYEDRHDIVYTKTAAAVLYGNNYTVDCTATRKGYEFAGWSETEGASSGTVTSYTNVTANKSLWSTWNKRTYTISYELDGGTNAVGNAATYNIDSNITIAAPTKTGYTFTGWTVDAAQVDTEGTNTETITNNGASGIEIGKGTYGNLTLTANWTINQYTVIFKNGTTELQNSKWDYNATPTYSGATPTKASDDDNHYTFKDFGTVAKVTADAIYTAQFTTTAHTWNITTEDATCTATGTKTYTCSVCGYVKTEEIKAKGHDYTVETARTASTCTTKGSVTYKCSRCDATNTVDLPLDDTAHNWGEWVYDSETKQHVKTCTYNSAHTQRENCNFPTEEKATVTKAATCTETGILTYTCSVCGGSYTEDIAKEAHTVVTDEAVAATCTTDGKTAGSHCSVCNTVIVAQETVAALGHSFTTYVSDGNATCTADGTKTAKCDREGCTATDTVTDTDSALGHNFDDSITANVTIVAATCTKDGSKTVKCSRCDETQVTALTQTGHNFTGDVQNNGDGTHSFKCVNTGCDVYGGTVSCSDFDVDVKEPTTEEKGYTTHTCKVCGYSYVDTYTIKNEDGETLNVGENQFIIRFVNEDGTLLQLLVVNKDDTPTYTKVAPTKTATAQYTYTHAGWTPTIAAATADATYTATFESTVNKYNVKFVNWDGTELKSETLDYGAAITAPETEPTRANCDFAGWDNTVAATVTGDVTYKATFKLAGTENIVKDNEYVITFVNYDGTVLDSRIYAKDATVTAPAATRANCTFKAWTPEFSATAVADATYTATFTTEDEGGKTVDIGKNQYVIRFVNEDGTLLQTKVVDAKAIPSYTGATPTKAADVQYTYTFSSWDDTIVAAAADKTYTATYTNTLNKYAVTVTGDEGVTVSANANVDYGTVYTLTVTANEHYTNTAPTATVNGTALALTKNGNTYTANVTVDGAKTIAVTSTINSNTLTVTYKYENGTQASATKTSTVDYNATYSVASETISGYVPVIETVKDDETINTAANTVTGVMPDSDVTVNVIYKVDANNNGTPDEDDTKLTVKYVAGANGAIKAGETTEIKVTYNGAYKTSWEPEVVADTDYMFSGWTNEPAAGTAITEDITITANFVEDRNHDGIADSEQASYTVKFVYGTEEKTASAKVLTGLTVPSAEVPDKDTLNTAAPEGECFKKWDNDPAKTAITADTTFNAVYATDANGDGTPDDEETPWTVTYSYNEHTETEKVLNNLTAQNVPTKETLNDAAPAGQCFANWNADTSAKITADTTFIAVYADDKNDNDIPDESDTYYTVTYKYNGHTATETVLKGLKPANVPTKAVLNSVAPEHQCFKKWDKATNVAITANTEFNAVYATDKNGDKNPDDEVALPNYDITVTAPANTTVDNANIQVEYAAETKITLTAATGYNLPANVTVKVGGTELTSDQYTYVDGVVTINEYVIVSDVESIVITGTATKVELTGTKAETTDANTTVKVTTDPVTVVDPTVVKVTAKDGYDLPETVVVKVDGKELATDKYSYNKTTGEITLNADVITSNDQVITVESTADKTVITGTKLTDVENINASVVTDPVTVVDPTVINISTDTGYEMPDEIVVKVDGVETKDYTYDKTTGNITLGKDVITKNGQEITVESKNELVKTEIKTVNVDTSDDTIKAEVTSKPVTIVDDTEITITPDTGYELPDDITVKVDGEVLDEDDYEYTYDSETGTGKIVIDKDIITSEDQEIEIIGNTTKKEVTGTTVTTKDDNISASVTTKPVTIVDETVIKITPDTGYELPETITVVVDGKTLDTDKYEYDKKTGEITLDADVITTNNQKVEIISTSEKTQISDVDIKVDDDNITAEITNKPVTVVDDTEITITPDTGYELPDDITVKVDGEELEDDEYTYDSETGKIVIDKDIITGEDQKIEIIGNTTKKEITGTTVTTTDENTSVEITSKPVTVVDETVIKITSDEGYDLPKDIKVIVDGEELDEEKYDYDPTTGEIKIDADVITGNDQKISIESEATKTELKDVDITAEDKNITVTVDNINKLDDTEITLTTDKKYELPDDIKVVVDGKELDEDKYTYDKETGKVKINKDVITTDGQKVEIKGTATRITVWGDWESNGDGTMTRHSEEEGYEDLTQTVDCTNFNKKVIAPTCTVGGYTVYTCKDCGYTFNADETDAAGHKWGSWKITSEATPEELGYKERECSVCHEKETVSYEFNSENKREIRFVTISKMHYQFLANSQEFAIYRNSTVSWYQGASLRFKVYNYTNTNVPYIYMDGYVELKPDADGWYTVPASDDDVLIFASNAKVDQYVEDDEDDSGSGSSGTGSSKCTCLCHSNNAFLQFIWKIIAFFCKIFGVNKTCSCGKTHY